ncbi:Transcription elongation factor like, partial [Actinidia chinensis var. chinensis]
MPHRRRDEEEDEEELEPEEYEEEALDEEEDEEEDVGGGRGGRKRSRSQFIDDVAEEDDEEDEDEDEDDDNDFGGGGGGRRGRAAKRRSGSEFFDLEAGVADDDEEEEPGDDDFIVEPGADLQDEDDGRRIHRRPMLSREDDQEDVEALEKSIQARYARSNHTEYDEETTDVEQQALLPSVRDPKLWMVKCAIGREREAAVCLMQKSLDKGSELQIRSAIALDHLKNYIYVEADKEAHVKQACNGLRVIYTNTKITLVPIKEMTDVLSVESKAIDLSRDTWVRMKIGTYKGDLAKVVDVDNVRQRVTVKLIPRIDLQAIANKLEGREAPKKKAFVPPPRFMNVDEAREMHIRVERRRDPMTGDYYENINGMMFKDGFLYKTVSLKSISTQNIQPTFDELEKFRQPDENGDGDIAGLSTLFANRKKGHFMKGDQVIVVKGDLKNLKGWVEKVEEDNVHIRPNA